MASFKKDMNKQKWEETEFPLVCETCLGDNPYVRMTCESHGKKCKICEVPFTVFAWQAGTKGRLKKVEICKSCAQAKNVCQVCIYDLRYGLPVAVRDKILAEEGGKLSGNSSSSALAIPQSDANRSWFNAMQERELSLSSNNNSASGTTSMVNERAHAKLSSMARMEPRYERNLPKLCSHYAKGECNRGSNCPFRHEMPRDRNDPLSKQNTKDRFYGSNDPVANQFFGRRKEFLDKKKKERKEANGSEEEGDERAVSTIFIRFDDKDGNTLNIIPTEMDLRDVFYSFGEITSVKIVKNQDTTSNLMAFIEYSTSEAAELAILSMNRKEVKGRKIFVNWARQPKRGNEYNYKNNNSNAIQGPSSIIRPLKPPGSNNNSNSTTICLPAGFTPSAQVAAAVLMKKSGLTATASNGTTIGVPRPGGGVIKRAPGGVSASASERHKPYYPSADPGRLGSRSST